MPLSGEQVRDLRRPYPAEAIGFKIQTNPKDANGSATIVAFITARDAIARLNHVAPGDWEDSYSIPPVGAGLVCHLKVGGVTRSDVGHAQRTDTDLGIKSLYSDAFKRAAVKFEVGGFLYSLPKMRLRASDLKQYGNTWYMPDAAVRGLRKQYTDWLNAYGAKQFGDPLDHGSHEEAQGDIETGETPATAPEPVSEQPVTEVKPDLADMLRSAIRAKDAKQYKDDKAWFALKAKSTNSELLSLLAEHYTSLGGDPQKVKAQWKASR